MRKYLILAIVLAGLTTAVYFYSKKNNTSNSETIFDREQLYIMGSEQQIRDYLNAPKSKIHYADLWNLIERNRLDLLEMLLRDFKIDPNIGYKFEANTALLYAAENLKPKAVELLVKYRADVNYKNNDGQTALFKAATSINIASTNEELEYRRQIIKLLVLSGADINTATNYNRTVIKTIVFDGDMELVKYLIESGGNINYIDQDGSNYLFYCNDIECLKYFVNQGLNINSTLENGENLLQGAVFTSYIKIDVIKTMLELGVDICHLNNDGNNVLDLAQLTDITPHLKNDNPDFYYKKIEENKNRDVYLFLKQEYLKKCGTNRGKNKGVSTL